MRRIAVPVLMAGGCAEGAPRPFDWPLPIVPDGTPTSTIGEFPFLGGSSSLDPPYDATNDRCTTRPAHDVACIDADLVPPQWRLAPGYDWLELSPITEDVNGDGLLYAHVSLRPTDSDTSEHAFVFAPLVRELILPRDADLQLVDSWCWFGDWTMDGQVDGLCSVPDPDAPLDWWESAFGLVVGPLAGVVTPSLEATLVFDPPSSFELLVDTDLDGLPEPVVKTSASADLWRGSDPSTWLTADPSLTIELPCELNWGDGDIFVDVSMCANDDEGDGVRDLEIWRWPDYDCNTTPWLVPADAVGVIDVETSPLARHGRCLDPAGDQDGDGVADFHIDDSVTSGPIQWIDGSPVSSELFTVHDEFYAEWTGVDFTRDGIHDWWGRRDLHADIDMPYAILAGGIGGGITTGTPSWHVFSAVNARTAYAENDTGYLVFDDDGTGVRFVAVE